MLRRSSPNKPVDPARLAANEAFERAVVGDKVLPMCAMIVAQCVIYMLLIYCRTGWFQSIGEMESRSATAYAVISKIQPSNDNEYAAIKLLPNVLKSYSCREVFVTKDDFKNMLYKQETVKKVMT